MTAYPPILVPFDGSTHSRHAAALAYRIAARRNLPVILLYVGDEIPAFVHEEAEDHPGVEVVGGHGLVEAAIAAEADRRDASLIVMGARGRSVLSGLVFGSTARAVLSACRRPALVVHSDSAQAFPEGGGGHVVAGVEPGEQAALIALAGRNLARQLGATLHLVTVMNVDRDLAARPRAYGIAPATWQKGVDELAAAAFGPLSPKPDEVTAVVFGIPDVELRRYADRVGAGVVVCGRRGTTGTDVDAWRSVAFALASHGPFATLVM